MCHHFFIFNCTWYKSFDFKEYILTHSFQNHYSQDTNHSPTTQGFIYGETRMPQQESEQEEGSPCKRKAVSFCLLLDFHNTEKLSPSVSLLITDHILGKEVYLIAFRQILPKVLPVACIFIYRILTCLKNQGGTEFLNRKQCAAESSVLLHSPSVDCHPLPLNLYGKPWREILPNIHKCTHFHNQKNPS